MSGFDLAPLAKLLLLAALLGGLPLLWLWRRQRGAAVGSRAWLQGLTLLTLFLTFDLVVFGAFTRLTDSGLGCPDWPGCYGEAHPFAARAEIQAAQTAMPTGPVTHGKAWIEMTHRYLAGMVGFLILLLCFYGWRAKDEKGLPRPSPWWPTLTLVWVLVQGAFGALTVTMKLFPAIVTLHLLFGLGLLMLLAAQAQIYEPKLVALSPALRRGLLAVWLLVLLQVALGGWVSTNYAVLACDDFPSCHSGQWWPATDFAAGFTLWRHLGVDAQGGWLPYEALTAIHLTHRIGALVVTLALLALVWRLAQIGQCRWSRRLGAVLALQVLSGLSNVVLDWPIVAALAHTAGAGLLLTLLTVLMMRGRAKQ
ncbi:COX15/CtaA family protein [Pelomonas sp. SE-A7]|uniref:COX15/CtaA family protein n=1 Tax=Pelomonas sp. SE-A7 TaxID=3054953 RepID=UPI00259CECA9|nr:COX15/CtaA family protein [Pelomonas sp. SE-A7]MDM4767580.1 COX15/CtaA family protein [Pelomonas sp. SE-A7]